MNLQDLISMSVGILYVIPFILYWLTGQTIHLKGWLGLMGTLGLSHMLKVDIVKEASLRPKGACDCDLLCIDGNQEGKPGMPSGHSSAATFFSAFYYQQTTNPWIKGALVLYSILVMTSRYLKRCHNFSQIAAGGLIGLLMNYLVQSLIR
jgi:membrane-associated phospholipid phosphatase